MTFQFHIKKIFSKKFAFFFLQSDIFGSLNDQGLLSRASEALVAMDMKHPVVSSASHQVFPPIKSDMMYSHPAISSGAGTPISRTSNQVRKVWGEHSLIRGVLIQICSAGDKNLTNYLFCRPQFSGVIQNIENHCAILTLIV